MKRNAQSVWYATAAAAALVACSLGSEPGLSHPDGGNCTGHAGCAEAGMAHKDGSAEQERGGATSGGNGNGGAGAPATGGTGGEHATGGGGRTTEAGGASANAGRDAGPVTDASLDGEASPCANGSADCNGKPGDGCEVDLTTDRDNCGTCRHGCLGADCRAGLCEPIRLAVDPAGPTDLAVNSTDVYWPTGTTVQSVPITGGAVRAFASGETGLYDLVVDDEYVYWTIRDAPGALRRKSLAPDAGAPETVYQGLNTASDLELFGIMALDAQNVYFMVTNVVLWGGVLRVNNAAYLKWPKHGTVATRVYPSTGYLPRISTYAQMTVRGPFLYAAGGTYEVDRGGWVVKLGIDGQSFATIWSSDVEAPLEVAADSTRVYVSTYANSDAGGEVGKGVYSFPNTGGATTRLSDDGWHGMTTDETDVYYSRSDRTIVRQPLGGGPTTVLVTGHDAYEMVVTADAVYWAEPYPGEIWKVAK